MTDTKTATKTTAKPAAKAKAATPKPPAAKEAAPKETPETPAQASEYSEKFQWAVALVTGSQLAEIPTPYLVKMDRLWSLGRCEELEGCTSIFLLHSLIAQGQISIHLLRQALGMTAHPVVSTMDDETIALANEANNNQLVVELAGWNIRRYANSAKGGAYLNNFASTIARLALVAGGIWAVNDAGEDASPPDEKASD